MGIFLDSNMNMSNFYFLLFVAAICVHSAYASCSLKINGEFTPKSPLLLVNNKNFVYPSKDDPENLNLKGNQKLNAACSGSSVEIRGTNTNEQILPVTCSSDTFFKTDEDENDFKDFTCSKTLASTTRYAGSCPKGRTVEIGFELPKNGFAKTITACFNEREGRTTWAHAVIAGAIAGKQNGMTTPSFRVASHWSSIPINSAYTRNSQRQQMLKIMDDDREMVDQYIPNTGEHYFAKGHLVARADLFYKAQQDSTFYYVNSLPMWQSINNGNWKSVENNVRQLAGELGDLDVYTGGLYTLELPNADNELKEIFLTRRTDSNKPAVPAPRILFKLVHHSATNKAIVYVTVNNPYMTDSEVDDNVICRIHSGCSDGRFSEYGRGYTYCCLYRDFIRDPAASTLGLPSLNSPRALF